MRTFCHFFFYIVFYIVCKYNNYSEKFYLHFLINFFLDVLNICYFQVVVFFILTFLFFIFATAIFLSFFMIAATTTTTSNTFMHMVDAALFAPSTTSRM